MSSVGHGGQGESLGPPLTRGSASLCMSVFNIDRVLVLMNRPALHISMRHDAPSISADTCRHGLPLSGSISAVLSSDIH